MIEILKLFKSYGKITALRNVSIRFDAGQCVALIGPNGSGKSTLIKSILDIVKPDSGAIHIDEKSLEGGEMYRGQIGYLPQISRFPEHMKVSQLFTLIKGIRKGYSSLDTTLYHELGINLFADRSLGGLSEGMRQKVNASLAFYFDPQILILDEPTSSLDPISSEKLRKKILDSISKGKLVIISSHILSDLDELATKVAYLMNGELIFYKSMEELRKETGEQRLNKIIPHLLKGEA